MTQTPNINATTEDSRVDAILKLALVAAEYPALQVSEALEAAVCALTPEVPVRQAVNIFRLITQDYADAIDLECRGADAVLDRLGAWSGTDYLTADEKATEMAVEARGDAVLSAAMLVSTQDALEVK
jgi:hypothetical protein